MGHTRVVDGIGHPIPAAAIRESGPDGNRTLASADSGFASLGTTAGAYVWKFAAPGHRPVWRAVTLAEGDVRLVPSPWLARESPAVPVSILDATALTTGAGPGSARADFPEAAFTQPGNARLTALGPQSLPFPLPFGWSPLGAMHVDLPESPTLAGTGRLHLTEPLAATEFLTLVQFEPESLTWRILQASTLDPAQSDVFSFPLATSGTFAAVVRDEGTGAPLPGAVGEALPGGTAQSLSGRVAAVSVVEPAQRAASLDPEAVTAQAQAVFTPATGVLPSSSWFRIAVQETYDLVDGTALRTPDYDATVYAYRRPAATIAPAESLPAARRIDGNTSRKIPISELGEGRPAARFPLRPQLLFGPADLQEAVVLVDVLPPLGDGAAALSAQGGVLESGDIRVTVPAGTLDGFSAGSLRRLDPAGFAGLAGAGQSIVRAFELNLGRLLVGAELQLSLGAVLAPDTDFVLARLVRFPGGSGLAPVQRLATDASGRLASVEPAAAPRLPGFTGPGQYLLVQLPAAQALVTGQVLAAANSPAPGIGVRIASQRWLSVTEAAGRYFLLAPAGPGTALATHPTNGDGASADFGIADSLDPITLDLTLGALAPRIIATTPANGDTRVKTVAPITVEFSEKLAPASLGATPIALRAENAAGDVPGGATLDLSGRLLTFLPTAPLDPGLTYSFTVSPDLRDLQGLALQGERVFSFTTAPLAARGAGAQLTIYEPGGNGPTPADQALLDAIPGYESGVNSRSVAAIGSAGTADPEVPVILVNESTGATATVLSKPDGSFANFVEASEEDFISAVFVNAKGTRVTIPATKQKFDDGRIGLFRQGGILEAESDRGPIEVIIEPEAIASRTTFRLEAVPLDEVNELLGDVQPEGGQLLGGVRYEESVDPITAAADLSFPIRIEDLNLPDDKGPGDVGYALSIPSIVGGQTVFHVIDSMEFVADGPETGRLVTRSPPFLGLLLRQVNALRDQTGITEATTQVTQDLRNAFTIENILAHLLVPIMMPAVNGQQAAGKVKSRDPAVPGGDPRPVSGAFVRVTSNLALSALFRTGELFALSETDGSYALVTPIPPISGSVIATHPRFPLQRASGTFGLNLDSFGPRIASINLFFERTPPQAIDVEDTAPPLASVLQSPRTATIGDNEDQGAVLDVTVLDDLRAVTADLVPEAFFSPLGEPKDLNLIPDPELLSEESTGSGARLLRRFRVRSPESGRVIYRVTAADAVGNQTIVSHVVAYGGQFADSDPTTPRRVPFSWPPAGAENVPFGSPIILRFTKPVTQEMADTPSWVVLEPADQFVVTSIDLAAGGLEARIRYAVSASAGSEFKLSIDPSIAQQFPQVTDEGFSDDDASAGYSLEFKFAEVPSIPLLDTGLTRLRGTALSGNHLIVSGLASDGSSEVRSLRFLADDDGTMGVEEVDSASFEEAPSEVVFIPHYPLRLAAGVQPPRDYIAVFTGNAAGSKRLRLYNLEEDGEITEPFTRVGAISDSISLITKAKWDAPYVAYLELSAGVSSVQLLNFNAHARGVEATNLNAFPDLGAPGLDANNDGDFADAAEVAPLPASRGGQGLGVEFSYAPGNPGEVLIDFDFSADFALLGAVLRRPTGGVFVIPLAGAAGATDDQVSRAEFDETPKRVLLLPAQKVLIGGQEAQRDLAVVSTVAASNGSGKLIVVDLSNPSAPVILGSSLLPEGAGSANSIVPRGDGLLALATSSAGTLILDPRYLLEMTGGLNFTAALERSLGGLNTSARSFAADLSGLHGVAEGSQVRTAFTGPGVRLVTFPGVTPFDPAAAATSLTRDQWEQRLASAQTVNAGSVADFSQPGTDQDPLIHVYALVHAPGLAGEITATGVPPQSIELAAAAVNARGLPEIKNESCTVPTIMGTELLTARFAVLAAINFAKELPNNPTLKDVFKAAGKITLKALYEDLTKNSPDYDDTLYARRLSDIPTSPLYNSYLAGPIVLLKKDLTKEKFDELQNAGLKRRYLKASRHFWVGLGPSQPDASPLAPFASRQDEELAFDLDLEFPSVVPKLVNLAVSIVQALFSENPLPVILAVTKFIDVSLDQALVPGANALADGIIRRPVVFIGGVMGSTLEDDDGPLWTTSLIGFTTGTLTGGLQTRLEGLGFTPEGQPIAEMEPTDALRSALGVKDIYGKFLEYMVGQGNYREYDRKNLEASLYLDGEPNWESLVRNPDLFVFPYDWRQDNAQSAAKLEKYVKLIQAVHPDASKVNILAHSMGGLVGRRFVMDNKDKVDQFVTIATPFLGAAKTLPAMKYGDFDELAMNVLVPKGILKDVSRFLPSMHQLMPNRGYFDLGLRPLKEFGWDADLNGDDAEDYPYEQYREVMDTRLFETEEEASTTPITSHSEPLHNYSVGGLGSAYDWRTDTSDVRCTHIVGFQSLPKTIQGVRLKAFLEQDLETTDASVDLPAVDFLDTDDAGPSGPGTLLPLFREDTTPQPLRLSDDTFRLRFGFELERGGGDGTVPILSQCRGFKAGLDFNKPGSRCLPIVSRAADHTDDELASHNGMFGNSQLQKLVLRVLDEALPEEPELTASVPETAVEGSPVIMMATVANVPEINTGPVRILWSPGDGSIVYPGTEASHSFADNGTFTVTCAAGWETGVGALRCRTLNITNVPPTVTLEGPDDPVPARTAVTFKALVTDPGLRDTHAYEWDFGDGSGDGPEFDPDSFAVSHRFEQPGTYTVTVTATDDDGGQGQAQITVEVIAPAAENVLVQNAQQSTDAAFEEDPATEDVIETVTIFITGHDVDDSDLQILHDGSNVLATADKVLRLVESLLLDNSVEKGMQITVFRETKANNGELPQDTEVRFNADAEIKPISVRLEFRGATATRCVTWIALPLTASQTISVNWNWPSLLTADAAALDAMLVGDFSVKATSEAPCEDQLPPVVNLVRRDTENTWELITQDNFAQPTQVNVYTADLTVLEGEPITEQNADQLTFHLSQAPIIDEGSTPGRTTALAVADPKGNTRVKENARTVEEVTVDLEKQQEVREAVLNIFNDAAQESLFLKLVLSMDHVQIFEQGSGAALWKPNPAKAVAYVPGQSDNDYELLFPLWLNAPFGPLVPNPTPPPALIAGPPVTLDPENPTHFIEFEKIAHDPDFMIGDWYFKPPQATTENGIDLGFAPDPQDKAVYDAWRAAARFWDYEIPTPFANLDGESGAIQIDRLDPSLDPEMRRVLEHPLPPAVLLARLIFLQTQDEVVSQILPDVTFFAFRREHFDFAVMSLERPSPFAGNDPIGDSGAGRGLLLLKWVLEGEFLPEFNGFNDSINHAISQTRRRDVFNRLRDREHLISPEGYEWGLYQEFALLSASVDMRMKTATTGPPPTDRLKSIPFGDYITAHDKAALKKAGKAAIRGAMARLAMDDSTRSDLFTVNPEQYDDSDVLLSFEDIGATAAKNNLGKFPEFEAEDFDRFIGAKRGDPQVINPLLATPERVDAFIAKSFELLKAIQVTASAPYPQFIQSLTTTGNIAEREARLDNIFVLENGAPTATGSTRAGRLAMHGQQGDHEALYVIAANLQRRDASTNGPFTLTLSPSGGTSIICDDIIIPPDRDSVQVKHLDANRKPVLVIPHSVSDPDERHHLIELDGAEGATNQLDNDEVELTSYFLSLQSFDGAPLPSRADRKVLFRGLALNATAESDMISNELEQGRLLSTTRRKGLPDSVGAQNLLSVIRVPTRFNTTTGQYVGGFNGFLPADLNLIKDTPEELALAQTGPTTGLDTLAISTATRPQRAATAALTKSSPAEKALVIVLEVSWPPPPDSGFRYIRTTLSGPNGPVKKQVNAQEDEVVYLGQLSFLKADLYEITAIGNLPFSYTYKHIRTFP
ncbi:MAG: PKD domain-containing protein [Verrucomicrobiales bacterium]